MLHDLPRLRDRLAQDFEANTLPAVGNEPIRVMIERGLLVPEVALYAYLGTDDTVHVIAVEFEHVHRGRRGVGDTDLDRTLPSSPRGIAFEPDKGHRRTGVRTIN